MADPESKDEPGNTDKTPARQKEFTRRALIRAGWMVPVVTSVNIPAAMAQSPSPHNDVHGDNAHVDEIDIHLDAHADTPGPVHTDQSVHDDVPHSDTPTPHDDVPHEDTPPHGDHSDGGTHLDAHGDAHSDHDDHSDAHGDYVFKDHTDGG
ncbi:MAG TPA: hypothetical protein VF219_06285, partial [Vicinamibacterales bacterium]